MLPDPDTLLIEMERIRTVFQQAHMTLLVTVINAILTAVVLAPVVDNRVVSLWLGLIVAVSGGRWAIRRVFQRSQPKAAEFPFWAVVSVLGSLTTGILWGVGAIVMCPAIATYQLFLTFVIGGMCAGATTVNSSHWPTLMAFVVPAGIPLAVSFFSAQARRCKSFRRLCLSSSRPHCR